MTDYDKQWDEFKGLISRLVSTGVDSEASKILARQYSVKTLAEFIAQKKLRSEQNAIRIGGRKTRQS